MSQGVSGTSVAMSGLVITLGGVMVFSALTGTPITDVLAGKKAETLDSHGGSKAQAAASAGVLGTDTLGGAAVNAITGKDGTVAAGVPQPLSFGGPNAALLLELADVAQTRFNLTITATTNGSHVPGSLHYQKRAFDASGSEANMRAYANYVASTRLPDIAELIHNPGVAIKNGRIVSGPLVYAAVWLGHRDHVHTGA
jgi:hypothetical protein